VNDEEVVVKEAKVIPAERFEKKIDRTVAPHNPVETVGTINQQTVDRHENDTPTDFAIPPK